ncbi:MAG TPA: adenosine deaminase [Victivallales bacterium]|nr:adenosine deaminase [Victivallales bacterium]
MNNKLNKFIEYMPKIELHVHLEGSLTPVTLIKLAEKNSVQLPVKQINEIEEWYKFTDFNHFMSIYLKMSECIKTPEDIEMIAKDFLINQKKQNIIYTEITYTPYTHYTQKGISFDKQIEALNKAKLWGEKHLNIFCNFIFVISRGVTTEEGIITAEWIKDHPGQIAALGLGGPEKEFPPIRHKPSFDITSRCNIPAVVHAGETAGTKSIWGALNELNSIRIGHGVLCWDDPELVKYLKTNKIILEVCPSSNICLGVFRNLESHILPKLVERGLKITINSDDPPMFDTTLTNEYKLIAEAFEFDENNFYDFNLTALNGSFIKNRKKRELSARFETEWKNCLELLS